MSLASAAATPTLSGAVAGAGETQPGNRVLRALRLDELEHRYRVGVELVSLEKHAAAFLDLALFTQYPVLPSQPIPQRLLRHAQLL